MVFIYKKSLIILSQNNNYLNVNLMLTNFVNTYKSAI